MTLSRSFRNAARGLLRIAAGACPAAALVTAMCAALWAGPAAMASAARGQSFSAVSLSPTRVKYYIVPPAGNGTAASLFVIAANTLGNGNRFMEIFNLNKGRPQRAGGRLESPHVIEPGWILQLPADAAGPGVHFGVLPGASASPSTPATPQPTPQAASVPAAHGSGIGVADVAGGGLAVLAAGGLAFMFTRRRRARGKKATHARAMRPRPGGGRTGSFTPDFDSSSLARPVFAPLRSEPGTGRQPPVDLALRNRLGLPSRPSDGHAGRFGPDHPSWPATGLPSQPDLDYPRWPDGDYPSRPGADLPARNPASHAGQPGPGQLGPGPSGPGQPGSGQPGPGRSGSGQQGPGPSGPRQPGPGRSGHSSAP